MLSKISALNRLEVYIFNETLNDKFEHSNNEKRTSINYYKIVKFCVMVEELYGLIISRANKVRRKYFK